MLQNRFFSKLFSKIDFSQNYSPKSIFLKIILQSRVFSKLFSKTDILFLKFVKFFVTIFDKSKVWSQIENLLVKNIFVSKIWSKIFLFQKFGQKYFFSKIWSKIFFFKNLVKNRQHFITVLTDKLSL